MAPEIQRILLPTDFSECSRPALAQAAAIAHRSGAELHLLHVMMSHGEDPYSLVYQISDPSEIYHQQEALCSERLGEIVAKLESDGVCARSHLRRSFAVAPAILEVARENEIDFLVIGAHGRRGWRRFLLGSVAEETVRTAACPVLIVRENQRVLDFGDLRRIAVPVDFSEPSRAALRAAKRLATSETRLALLHAIELPVLPHYYSTFRDPGHTYAFQRISGELREALARAVQEAEGPDVTSEIEILEGAAAESITRYAAGHEVDLLVIATHGLTGWKHLLLGSVAERVVRSATCPVLVLTCDSQAGGASAHPLRAREVARFEAPAGTA